MAGTIICYGDSNTYGLIPGTTRRYDRETRGTSIQNKTAGQVSWRAKRRGRSRITASVEGVFRTQEARSVLPANS